MLPPRYVHSLNGSPICHADMIDRVILNLQPDQVTGIKVPRIKQLESQSSANSVELVSHSLCTVRSCVRFVEKVQVGTAVTTQLYT